MGGRLIFSIMGIVIYNRGNLGNLGYNLDMTKQTLSDLSCALVITALLVVGMMFYFDVWSK